MKPKIAAAVVLSTALLVAAAPAFAGPPPAGRECSRHTSGRNGSTVRTYAKFTLKGKPLGRRVEWTPPQTDTGGILGVMVHYENPTIESIGPPARVTAYAKASIRSFAGAIVDFDADGTQVRRPLGNLAYWPASYAGGYMPEMSLGSATLTGQSGKGAFSMELLPLVETMTTLRVRLSHLGFQPMQIDVDLAARADRDRMFRKTLPKIEQQSRAWRNCPAFW